MKTAHNDRHRPRAWTAAVGVTAWATLLCAPARSADGESPALQIARRSDGTAQARSIASRSAQVGHRSRRDVSARPEGPTPRPAAVAPVRRVPGTAGLDAAKLERTERYDALIDHHSRLHGVDTELIKAIVYTESGGNARALSPRGAQGLMQLMPGTAGDYGASDPSNPEQSISSGTRYMRDLLDQFGSTEVALWAYNAGPGAVRRGHLPHETQTFVPKVLTVRRLLRAREQAADGPLAAIAE